PRGRERARTLLRTRGLPPAPAGQHGRHRRGGGWLDRGSGRHCRDLSRHHRDAEIRSKGRAVIRRLAFLIPAGLAMLAGLDAALLLLGVWAPVSTENLPDLHAIVMVFGCLGTVIALERAVALAKPVGFPAPGLLGLGAIVLLTPAPLIVGQIGLVAGSLALTVSGAGVSSTMAPSPRSP